MKKFITLICLTLIGYAAQAQVITLYGSHAATDTLTNAGTEYLTTQANALNSIGLSGKYDIQLTIANVSGTTAGTVILQSSIDGVNWTNHFRIYGIVGVGTNGIQCDSLSFSGATTHVYTVNAGVANAGRRLYIRLKFVGTGTQVSILSAKLITQE